MAFNIDGFKSRIGSHLASPANFRIIFSGAIVSAEPARELAFLCNQAQLPGRAFSTLDISTHGPVRKIPYQNVFDDVVLSFYVKESLGIKKLFQEWQSFISSTQSNNNFSYFDDFVTDITIEQFDNAGNRVYACKLIDAYPLMTAPIQLDWADKDSFENLQVTFAYHNWREEPLSLNPFGNQLQVNALYPNFDVGGALENFGVALFSKTDGSFMSSVGQGINFQKNLGKSKTFNFLDNINLF
jgi:hypothetical protein